MYRFCPKLVLRTPAFGYRVYAEADVNQLVKERYFQAAILLASPALYRALQEKEFKYEELPQKVRFSLQKYLNRMCFRPTPFGLFSGFSTVRWGAGGQLPLLQKSKLKVHADLDFSQTLQIAEELLHRGLASHHTYSSNSSLYRVQDEYRYLRFETDAVKDSRNFFIDSFSYQKLLQSIVSFCKTGQSKEAIIQHFAQQTSAIAEDSAVFFEQLVNEQILVSTLQPNITGEDYLHRLIRFCDAPDVKIPGTGSIYAWQEALKTIPEISDVANRLPQIFSRKQAYTYSAKKEAPFYVNLEKELVAGELSREYQSSVLDGLHCLQSLVPAAKPQGLQNFISAFNNKFENRTVPLLVTLDPELGVGYEELAAGLQTPKLLQDIAFTPSGKAITVVEWTPAHALLLDKWQAATKTSTAIRLTEQDIAILPQQKETAALPPSISVLFRIINGQVYLEQAGGVSATALLGRFTPLNPDICAMSKDVARQEETANPNVIFAEIAHICNEHTANIDRRAAVRKYEIPVLVQSTLHAAQQIPLSELWVRVEEGRIILWSERLRKVIVPRLSSAFNYIRDDLAIFRFLCDLQYQGLQSNFTLDLSSFFPNLSYYPRVEYKSAILHLATWHLKKEQLQPVLQAAAAQSVQLKQLANELGWPRHIALTQNDHQLVFDLERETDISFFLDSVKNTIIPNVIKEFPFAEERAPVVIDEDRQPYIHQFLAALYHQQEVYPRRVFKVSTSSKIKEKKRKLLAGSEWLYFKIYCHPSRSNQLLTAVLLPVLNQFVKKGEARQWFFVRYRDPDYHLRLRLHLPPGDTGNVLSAVSRKLSKLVQKGIIADVQLAVYERELERYGPDLIEAVEYVFCAGSALIAAYLKEGTAFDETEYAYYRIAFSGLEDIPHAFELDLEEKVQLLHQLYEAFYKEFRQAKALKETLSLKYREISRQAGILPGAAVPVESRLKKLHLRYIASLQAVAQKTQAYPPARKAQLVADLMHMHLNRVFVDQARKQELVVYYCLWKHYRSALARLIR